MKPAPHGETAWYRRFWLAIAAVMVVLYIAAPWYWRLVLQ